MTEKINWQYLAATLKDMGEQQVLELLIDEQDGGKRPFMLRRLHQRYCALRNQRERAEIMARAGL